jgi:hypothetical protein
MRSIANVRQDNSDAQYRSFRHNLGVLCKAALGYLALRYAARRLVPGPRTSHLHLIPTNVVLSLLMIVALHGSSAIKILLIMAVNYLIAKKCRSSRLAPFLTWAFNGLVLFGNEIYSGYRFGAILPGLAALVSVSMLWWHGRAHMRLGFIFWHLSAVACELQYHHAPPHLFQHGLLLGVQEFGKCRCGYVFFTCAAGAISLFPSKLP